MGGDDQVRLRRLLREQLLEPVGLVRGVDEQRRIGRGRFHEVGVVVHGADRDLDDARAGQRRDAAAQTPVRRGRCRGSRWSLRARSLPARYLRYGALEPEGAFVQETCRSARLAWRSAGNAWSRRREGTAGGGPPDHQRRARTQPAGDRSRSAAGQPDRLHRTVGIREIEPGVRHDLRRGAASLRGVAVRVRAPVPRPDGQARRRLHRGPVPGGVHRPEVDQPQPAFDGRHHHRGLRLPAPAVRPRRHPALPGLRRADREADAAADRGSGARDGGGHPFPGARAGGAHPQGRVRRPVRPAQHAGLLACPRRRRRCIRSPTRRS